MSKEIKRTEWLVSKHLKFVSYTALWCNPCEKIKPDVLEYMKSHDIIHEKMMLKDDFKKNVGPFIPLFQIFKTFDSYEEDTLIKEIQTSDFEKLEEVLVKHFEKQDHKNISEDITPNKFELDDDF
jgi:thiol-disulfide isomerase/thioredoxin